jgi:hypothetical protein
VGNGYAFRVENLDYLITYSGRGRGGEFYRGWENGYAGGRFWRDFAAGIFVSWQLTKFCF